jgi:hypothetical protein
VPAEQVGNGGRCAAIGQEIACWHLLVLVPTR